LNAGFTCIANILEGMKTPPTGQGVQEILGMASEQLRLLAHVVKLAGDDPAALPVVGPEQATHHAGPHSENMRRHLERERQHGV
jgi:hypothetical protein